MTWGCLNTVHFLTVCLAFQSGQSGQDINKLLSIHVNFFLDSNNCKLPDRYLDKSEMQFSHSRAGTASCSVLQDVAI